MRLGYLGGDLARVTALAAVADEGAGEGHFLTSGDIARMLHVDLKTIHNWVNQGHLVGRRTKGRHLRFFRTEIVRFMRLYGYPVADFDLAGELRLLVHGGEAGRVTWLKSAPRGAKVTPFTTLSECLLLLASGDHEVVCLDLDRCESKQLREFLDAVANWPLTLGLTLVGISERPALRRQFLAAGGQWALPRAKSTDFRGLVTWLTGGVETPPAACERAAESGS